MGRDEEADFFEPERSSLSLSRSKTGPSERSDRKTNLKMIEGEVRSDERV